MQDPERDNPEQAPRQTGITGEDYYEIDLIKKCIKRAGGPCSTEYIKDQTGYNLKDPSQSRIYNYFINLSKEGPVKGYKYEYAEAAGTFEYIRVTPIKTVEDLVKHLESQEKARTEGLDANEVIDVLCLESTVLQAEKEKKIICIKADTKIKRILSFKEGEDCEVLPPKKSEVFNEFEKTMDNMKGKKIEKLLEEKGLFVFKNPEKKIVVSTKPRRGKRPGTTSKSVTK